jgi:hypothetical protein
MKLWSILIRWNDSDTEEGEFGTVVKANTQAEAEDLAYKDMDAHYVKSYGREGWEDEEEDPRDRYGSVIECVEGPMWRAKELHAVLQKLVQWGEHTGGWEAPVWDEAKALLQEIDKSAVVADDSNSPTKP